MAKPTAPLLSFDGSGTIAKTAVYAKWRGRNYVRRWVSPANPQTTAQMETRDVFSWLQQVWKRAPSDMQAPWTQYSKGQPFFNRNAFGSFNISALRTATTLENFVFEPGAGGGIPATSITVTPGAGDLTIDVTAPTPPSGWTLTEAVAAAIADQDPHSGLMYDIALGTDATTPYTIILSGLTASSLYRVAAWLVWAKPDGSTAYGAQVTGSGTPT